MQIKIIADPIVNIYYASYYLQGLIDKFGRKSICFDSKPFECITNRAANFNFIVVKENKQVKYSIHFDDPYNVKIEHYNWCDVYGNVNANFEKTPKEFHEKLISLSPSFGIRLWTLNQTLYYCISNLLKVNSKVNVRKFIGKYRRQYALRLPIKKYQSINQLIDNKYYIFHLSTLWHSDEWNKNDVGVNKVRADFIRVCKSIENVNFEGGLFSKHDSNVILFKDVIYKREMTINDYIAKTKQSTIVFNTPAFWDCHGWKLGEFLALGKAIISTPLSNDLPVPLEHGINIHFIANESEVEIKKAVLYILNNIQYREKLEKGSREYWEKYGTPEKSLELLGI